MTFPAVYRRTDADKPFVFSGFALRGAISAIKRDRNAAIAWLMKKDDASIERAGLALNQTEQVRAA